MVVIIIPYMETHIASRNTHPRRHRLWTPSLSPARILLLRHLASIVHFLEFPSMWNIWHKRYQTVHFSVLNVYYDFNNVFQQPSYPPADYWKIRNLWNKTILITITAMHGFRIFITNRISNKLHNLFVQPVCLWKFLTSLL